MTSSVHICLTVVTEFLIIIFYRNQLQRASSKETLCAREVHRMILEGLNVQIWHQKMVYTSYMFWWNEAKLLTILVPCFRVCMKFGRVWSVSKQALFAPRLTTLTSKLQRHLKLLGKFGFYTKKNIFPETSKIRRNSGNPKKTEIIVLRISNKSIW